MAGRVLGWFFAVLAVVFLGRDIYATLSEGSSATLLGKVVADLIGRAPLTVFQAGVERYLTPLLWQWVIQPVLVTPAWFIFAMVGGVLLVAFRKRRRRRSSLS